MATAMAWDALLVPVLAHYESRPADAAAATTGPCGHFKMSTCGSWPTLLCHCTLHQPFGGAGLAHGQAAHEDRGVLPHAGRGQALRSNASLVETARKQKQNVLDLLRPDPDAAAPQPNRVPTAGEA